MAEEAPSSNSANEGGEFLLESLRLWDELRLNATDVTRAEGSNIDRFTTPDGEEVALCHITGIIPFTSGSQDPSQTSFEGLASAALAIQHLNAGDGSIVPQVEGLNKRCNVRFSTEWADSERAGGVSMSHVVDFTNREPNSKERLPCAFLGAYKSSVSIPMSIATGLFGYPQVSPVSTSADLDDKSQYPLFGRTVPSDAGTTVPIIRYIREVLQVSHLAVINVNDAYGNAFVDGMRDAATLYAPDMVIHQIPLDDDQDSIEAVITNLKSTHFRFVFCLAFGKTLHDNILSEAYRQGVAGTGHHNWLFGDSFGYGVRGRTFEKGSPLHLAYRGAASMEVSGGVEGIPNYDRYVEKMAELGNSRTDLEYLASLFPKNNYTDYGTEEPPYINNGDFLVKLRSGYVPFMYEAVISLGLSACTAYEEHLSFTGQEHYDHMLSTNFTGISGEVFLDQTTGTRDPNSALYKVSNYVEQEAEEDGMIEFGRVITDLFHNGVWDEQRDFIFNDGTTNLPIDVDPPSDELNWTVVVFVPVIAALIMGIIGLLIYQNRRKNDDSVWKVSKDELEFGSPPEVIGRGTFGLVLLAEYRGTRVAVKRVIPPSTSKSKGSKHGSKSTAGTGETDLFSAMNVSGANSSGGGGSRSGSESGTGAPQLGKMSWGGLSLSNTNKGGSGGSPHASGVSGMLASTWVGRKHADAAMLKKMKQEFVEEMRYLSKLRHPCITTIMGAVTGSDPMLVMEYMEHGSLYDLLHNETMALDEELILPILQDISQGLRFLHSANPSVIHGDLKAANILVDTKFRAKVADFGLSQKQNLGGTGTPYWMAPELLRKETANTTASDVFSFGVILFEVFSRRDPYEDEDPVQVLRGVADKTVKKRPPAPRNMPDNVKTLMADCVEDEASVRPAFGEIDTRLRRIVETADLSKGAQATNKASQVSLFDIFPRHIAEALRDGHSVEPEHKDCVTIFFSDIVGFTNISAEMEPRKIASMLDRLYTKFDKLSQKHDIFKVETIGDAYMAVTNLVKDQHDDHAKRIAEFAVEAIAAANQTLIDLDHPEKGCVNIRVGFHSGSVVADVVGTRNPRYCLFGDTVNTASRMESNSKVNRIHCSKPAAKLLHKQCPSLPIKSRGKIPIKGKGTMHTYWVNEDGDGARASKGAKSSINDAKMMLEAGVLDGSNGKLEMSSDDFAAPGPKPERKAKATMEEAESTEFEIQSSEFQVLKGEGGDDDIEAQVLPSSAVSPKTTVTNNAPPESAPPPQSPLLARSDSDSPSAEFLKSKLEQRLASYKSGQSNNKIDEISV